MSLGGQPAAGAAFPQMRGEGALRWYVVKVREGGEKPAARDLARAAGSELVRECFAPRVQLLQKRQGQWVTVERALYPGYVLAVTDDPRRLDRRMAQLTLPARLVGRRGVSYVPLPEGERGWLERALGGDRVLRPSRGVIEDGRLHVEEGPLVGCESRVRRIDRHKSAAYVEMGMPDGRALLRVALAVTSKT